MDNPAPELRWGVRPALPLSSLGLAALLAGWAVIAGQPEDRLVAGAGAVIFLFAAGGLWALRHRLTIDANGFLLRGPLGLRAVGWPNVAAVSAPERRRRGLTSTSLEIELDDDSLIILGRVELGADPAEVAPVVADFWVRYRSDIR